MRRFFVAFVAAALFALAPVGVTLAAASSSLSAAPSTTVTHRSGMNYFPMSASMCAFAKKAYPRLARDPKLCQMEHGWTATDTMTQSGQAALSGVAVAQASSCPSGTSNFHDWIEDVDHVFWQYDMNTSFTWHGNCAAPKAEQPKLLPGVVQQHQL